MALIYFYDATERDRDQLSAELQHTDHHWEYVEESISEHNINPDTEVISVFVSSSVTKEMIEKMPRLALIACRSTGYNNIDLRAAEERGICVVNVPTYGEKTVAEYTFALLLALTRKLYEAIRPGDTNAQPLMMGTDLAGKTIGVIGTGKIGANVMRIARGFDMRIVAFDPLPKDELTEEVGCEYTNLESLLENADIVTLHVPYTGNNKHLLNETLLARMKKGSIIINTSRGELIDTSALIHELNTGRIAAAGLDVIEDEHLFSLHGELELLQKKHVSEESYLHSLELLALQKMPNVIVTPHNAFNTAEALARINQTTADNIVKFWFGSTPNKVVAPKQGMGRLFVVRHTESEWNAKGVWTGITDVHLSEKGFKEAAMLGQLFPADVQLEKAYASEQIRTLETLSGILDASRHFDVPIERIGAINERDYGDYTGKNKWEVKEQIGEQAFQALRRGWDYPVPNGETLKDVFERVFPFYRDTVVPQLIEGKNILIAAHGNSIRALMHYVESIPEEKMGDVEMIFGTLVEYEVDESGRMKTKKEYKIDSPKPPA